MVANMNRVTPDHLCITELHKKHKEWQTGKKRFFTEWYLYNIAFLGTTEGISLSQTHKPMKANLRKEKTQKKAWL